MSQSEMKAAFITATNEVIERKDLFFVAASFLIGLGMRKLLKYVTLRKEVPAKPESPPPVYTKPEEEALEERKPSNLWNTAMFFPDFEADKPNSTTQQFLWYFSQARTSIRICIYNFSLSELESVLIQQYERGLIVQFVVGHEQTAENFRRHSIRCGVVPRSIDIPDTDQLMHHKFAVIDDEAAITGSMNWTTDGILNNRENVCVSTNANHVEKYLSEFYRLLKICELAKTYY